MRKVTAKRYDFADDLITQVDDPDSAIESARHLLYDGLGSTRSLTNELGDVGAAYNYTPFGSPLGFALHADQPHLFAGEWFDASLGYSYNRARYYDTATGRFTGFDADEDAVNRNHRYAYAASHPTDFTDPTGEWTGVEIQVVQAIVSLLVDLQVESGVTHIENTLGAEAGENVRQVFTGFYIAGIISGGAGLGGLGAAGIKNLPRVTKLFAKKSFRIGVGSGRQLIRVVGGYGSALDAAKLPKKIGFE